MTRRVKAEVICGRGRRVGQSATTAAVSTSQEFGLLPTRLMKKIFCEKEKKKKKEKGKITMPHRSGHIGIEKSLTSTHRQPAASAPDASSLIFD